MRTRTWHGLIACMCAGALALPAIATDPPVVGIFNPDGKQLAVAGLAYSTAEGETHKAMPNGDGTFSLDLLKSNKVTIHLDGEDLEIQLVAGLDGIGIYPSPSGCTVKCYDITTFDTLIAGFEPVGARSVMASKPDMVQPGAPRDLMTMLSARGGGGSNDCATAQPISGSGSFAVDTSAATSVGPNDPACAAFGFDSIRKDVWFAWTAAADGTVSVTTCGGVGFDSKIAAYDGTSCPPGSPLDCNDDDCGLQSSISFTAVNGNTYLIRIGTYPGGTPTGGSGTFQITASTGPGGMGGADDCGSAEAIAGQGLFAFDNSAATTDGVADALCDAFGQNDIENDVWFCWSADADGTATVQTCSQTAVDTRLAAYDGCSCPTGAGIIACNDDSCALQSRITFPVVNGNSYLLRVGQYPGATGGTGNLDISIGTGPVGNDCNEPAANCQAGDVSNAFNSNGVDFIRADDFSPAADGSVSSICFFGTYFDGGGDCGPFTNDNFVINYYDNAAGFPGNLLASFSQAGGTLTVTTGTTANLIAGFLPEYAHTATHAPVAVTGGACYWVQITNAIGGCSWFWEIATTGNGRGLQDGPLDGYTAADATPEDAAFCLDVALGDASGCLPPPPPTTCVQPAANCQANDPADARTSTAGIFTTADDFEVPASRATISAVCWWGGYFNGAGDCSGAVNDSFTLSYYADNGGVPGALIASYSQGGGTLQVTRGAGGNLIAGFLPDYEYSATHPPLTLNAGDCAWIEIVNDTGGTGCNWFWEIASQGNGQAMQDGGLDGYQGSDRILADLAFCLDSGLGNPSNCLPGGPANDDCAAAEDIPCNGSASGDNTFATSDPTDPGYSCHFNGPGAAGEGSIWYTFVATDTSAFVETNNSFVSDTLLAIYDGSCGSLTEIACSEDEGDGLLSEVCVENLSVGTTYYIQVSTFPGSARGTIVTDITCPCPGPAENDFCADATSVGVPSSTPGSTENATTDSDGYPFCGTSITSPGVWYSVIGTGNTLTASLCDGNTSWDSKISVYCGDCADPAGMTCIVGIDDFCGLQSQVSWCSQAGAEYLVLVHGFGGATGDFELDITEGGSCTGAIACLPTGACCFDSGTCEEITEDACNAAGGTFQGVGTTCSGSGGGWTQGTGSAFEDISGTGTIAPTASNSDDAGDVVPIGFTFNFFGDDHTTIGITSNGYLTFGSDLSDFTEDPIPNTLDPSDLITALWDDYDPVPDNGSQPDGVVYYETLGTAPNRRFVAQWSDMRQFGGSDSNTFQVALYEGSNCVELRWGAFDTSDFVAGVENQDGTDGVSVGGSAIPGGSTSLCPLSTEPPCPPGGACCYTDGSCEQLTEEACDASGGFWQGEGSACGGENLGYQVGAGTGFEDISGTGTVAATASNSDDDGEIVPIGFTFNFYGDYHTDFSITSNGYLTFGPDDSDFTEDAIPNTTDPSDLITALWDDFDPVPDNGSQPDGVVQYETRGTAPNRRFIAQWSDMRQFAGSDTNTFQVTLFEGSDCVELSWQTVQTGDFVAGIENQDGTDGIDLSASVAEGGSVSICPAVSEDPCPIIASLIIKQGACPAPLNRNGNGVIPMVLTGDIGFDVNDIDLDSLLLSRADGVGGSVAPLNGPPGPKIKINDLNHPYVGPGPCSCNADQSADGIDDVQMKFSTGATVAALELDSLSPGDIVGFVLSGQTLGGDDFIATDCMQIVPQASPVNLLVQSNVENAWIRLAPEDVVIDGEGFAGFERTFLPGTTLNLTAPLAWNGKVFAHWNVNGVSQGPGRVLDLTIWDTTTVDAIFRDWGAPEPDFDAEAGVTGELQVIRP